MARKIIDHRFMLLLIAGMYTMILAGGCKENKAPVSSTTEEIQDTVETVELPSDFVSFYEKFHGDSVYQLSHIIFPLEAYLTDSAGRDSIATWTANNWKVHKPFVADNFWDHRFEMPVDGMVQEFIFSRDGSFYLQRRFARSKNEWYLIYYSGMKSNNQDWE